MKLRIIVCLVVLIALTQLSVSSRVVTEEKRGILTTLKGAAQKAYSKMKPALKKAYCVGKFAIKNSAAVKGAGASGKECYTHMKALKAAFGTKRIFLSTRRVDVIKCAQAALPAAKSCWAAFKSIKTLYGKLSAECK